MLAIFTTVLLLATLGLCIFFTVIINKYKSTLSDLNSKISVTQEYLNSTSFINPYKGI
jgi:hypothetical protein